MGATKTQQIVNLDDKDLVQLAGYYAYKLQKRGAVLEVNQRMFRVEHVEKNLSSMEAIIV